MLYFCEMKSNQVEFKSINISRVCFYAGLCMFLSAIEYAIPKPLPFLRLGLANLPIILAVKQFLFKEYVLLVLLKVLTQAMISGTILSYVFVFSICGTLASSFVMWILWKLLGNKLISNIGLSLSGAIANISVQIGLCYLMMFGTNTKYIIVFMLTFGSLSGLILGLFCNLFEVKSKFCLMDVENFDNKTSLNQENLHSVDNLKQTNDRFYFRVSAGLILFLGICFVQNVMLRWIFVFTAFIMNYIIRKGKVKILPSVIVFLSVVIMSIFQPNGRLLITCGNLKITEDVLLSGIDKAGKLIGMVFTSQILFYKTRRLPGFIGLTIGSVIESFNVLTQRRIKFEKKNVFVVLDDWILNCWLEMQCITNKDDLLIQQEENKTN